jgi:hypothetical protein
MATYILADAATRGMVEVGGDHMTHIGFLLTAISVLLGGCSNTANRLEALVSDDPNGDSSSHPAEDTDDTSGTDEDELNPCDEAYGICNQPAGCILANYQYIEAAFPGTKRFVVRTENENVIFSLKLHFALVTYPGTELIAQASEPDCTLNTLAAQVHLTGEDHASAAREGAELSIPLLAETPGEHLIELYSDASAEVIVSFE